MKKSFLNFHLNGRTKLVSSGAVVLLASCLCANAENPSVMRSQNIGSSEHNILDDYTNATVKVKGTVKDKNQIPVIGANVIQKGTSNGVITDIDGNFVLEVPKGAVLSVSYIGFRPYEVTVDNDVVLDIVLEEDTEVLDEVVVVGYGTMRKSDLTGSVATAKV